MASWYYSEWLQVITGDRIRFQTLMRSDSKPLSTGGVYDLVGLFNIESGFKMYKK